MNILIAGDIVSSPGRKIFQEVVRQYRQQGLADAVFANAENAAGGNGLLPRLAQELFNAGADGLTLGDHAWDQKEIYPFIEEEYRLVRPANYVNRCPGRGWTLVDVGGQQICLISLVGRTFMNPPSNCPFRTADDILSITEVQCCPIRLVDFHAEATSEKIAMGMYLDGRVSAMVGTHTHVQTSDERIMRQGSGYITDLGMTGPQDSVLGRQLEPVLNRFMTGMPARFEVKKGPGVFEGVLIEVDEKSGKCLRIERVRVPALKTEE